MVNTIADRSVFGNGPFDRVMIEVSLITQGGCKVSARVDNDIWWSILNNSSKSMMKIEDELIELLTEGRKTDRQLAFPIVVDAKTGKPVKNSYFDWD